MLHQNKPHVHEGLDRYFDPNSHISSGAVLYPAKLGSASEYDAAVRNDTGIDVQGVAKKQLLAKTLSEIAVLEAEPDKSRKLSAHGCTVAARLTELRASLPKHTSVAAANPQMAPLNVPHTPKEHQHSGVAGYSGSGQAGRIDESKVTGSRPKGSNPQ